MLRENALLAFPPQAFEDEVVFRSFFGRQQIILNRPRGIHHILVENPQNYGRTRGTIRMLRPLLGNGLLLSEGEDWKHQRRTVAPAFAPRTIPLLARHVAIAADGVVAKLAAVAESEVDLLAAMQALALEIAGRIWDPLGISYYPETARFMDTLIQEEPIGYRLRPGLNATFWGSKVVVSSQGLREREVPAQPLPTEFRIVMLGDSFVFGLGVEYEQALPAQLDKLLNAQHNPGRTFRTINMGLPILQYGAGALPA